MGQEGSETRILIHYSPAGSGIPAGYQYKHHGTHADPYDRRSSFATNRFLTMRIHLSGVCPLRVKTRHTLKTVTFLSAAVLPVLGGCTMIEDKTDDCPSGLYVRFVYDYNTARADMFKDHCGYVSLYVYDETGKKVAERTVSHSDGFEPLRRYGYSVHFEEGELAPGRYRLQAVAMQKDWEKAEQLPGARHSRTDVTHSESLCVSLGHDREMIPGTSRHQVSAEAPLDTLWHTLKVSSYAPRDGRGEPDLHATVKPYSIYPIEDQYVTVEALRATYATVSLIRDTKHLNITLRDIDYPDEISHEDYEVRVLDNNAHLAHDNEVIRTDSLQYSPYAGWTSRLAEGGTIIDGDKETPGQRTAHFNVMFNRLSYNADTKKSARLQIINRTTGKQVALINLPYTLAEGRIAYDIYNYTPQEYLDREYDYRLDFLLKGGKWYYMDVVINVLSWSKRFQNVEL